MAIIKTISDLLWGMPLIVLILLAGIIFTVGSKFFQIAHLKHMRSGQIAFIQDKTFQSDILREKMDKKGFRLW